MSRRAERRPPSPTRSPAPKPPTAPQPGSLRGGRTISTSASRRAQKPRQSCHEASGGILRGATSHVDRVIRLLGDCRAQSGRIPRHEDCLGHVALERRRHAGPDTVRSREAGSMEKQRAGRPAGLDRDISRHESLVRRQDAVGAHLTNSSPRRKLHIEPPALLADGSVETCRHGGEQPRALVDDVDPGTRERPARSPLTPRCPRAHRRRPRPARGRWLRKDRVAAPRSARSRRPT